MTQNEMVRMAMALGMLYGVYKFVKNDHVKAAALGVAGVVIAKNVPLIRDLL